MGEVERNYAEALFGLLKKDELPEAMDFLRSFSSLLRGNPDIRKALGGYSLSKKEKEDLIETLAKGQATPIRNFLKVVSAHHRIDSLSGIAKEFGSLVCEALGYKEGIVYSADRLSEKELAGLEEAFNKKTKTKVVLLNTIDPSLLGGVKVYLDGKVYDGSLSSKLESLKQLLNGGSRQ